MSPLVVRLVVSLLLMLIVIVPKCGPGDKGFAKALYGAGRKQKNQVPAQKTIKTKEVILKKAKDKTNKS